MTEIIDSLIRFLGERPALTVSLGLFGCALIVTICKIIDTTICYRRRTNQRTQATMDALTAMARTVQRANKQSAARTVALRAQPDASEHSTHDAIEELQRIIDRQREYSNSIKRHRRDLESQQRGFKPVARMGRPDGFDLLTSPPPGDDR